MEDYNKLEEEFDRFERASVQVTVLAGQLVAVLAAVFLCSQWWHYAVLAIACFMFCPLWGNMQATAVTRWWEKNGGNPNSIREVHAMLVRQGASPEDAIEVIEDGLDDLDKNVPRPPVDESWPYKSKK